MKRKLKIFLIFAFCALSANSFAQDSLNFPKTFEERFEAYLKYLSPEKVYLHTDKDVYAMGDTVWFRGYVLNSSALSEYPESRYLYVELVGTTFGKDVITNRNSEISYVMRRVKVKMRDNSLNGYIPVPDDANTGYAAIRAYTYWNLNKDAEYVFSKELSIINPIKDNYAEGLKNKNIRSDSHYQEIGMENPYHPVKRVSTLDCAFLPESGRLLAGVKNRIGVKIINEKGLGQQAEGVSLIKTMFRWRPSQQTNMVLPPFIFRR